MKYFILLLTGWEVLNSTFTSNKVYFINIRTLKSTYKYFQNVIAPSQFQSI